MRRVLGVGGVPGARLERIRHRHQLLHLRHVLEVVPAGDLRARCCWCFVPARASPSMCGNSASRPSSRRAATGSAAASAASARARQNDGARFRIPTPLRRRTVLRSAAPRVPSNGDVDEEPSLRGATRRLRPWPARGTRARTPAWSARTALRVFARSGPKATAVRPVCPERRAQSRPRRHGRTAPRGAASRAEAGPGPAGASCPLLCRAGPRPIHVGYLNVVSHVSHSHA